MTLLEKVKETIKLNPKAKDNYHVLIASLYSKFHNVSPESSFSSIISKVMNHELPDFESIIVSRRKAIKEN
jgi:hypothetical protein